MSITKSCYTCRYWLNETESFNGSIIGRCDILKCVTCSTDGRSCLTYKIVHNFERSKLLNTISSINLNREVKDDF